MYTIGEASRRSGVGISLIRAWERRYGLVAATRTASGYRLYDDAAVARLRRVRELTEAGWSASEASRTVLAGDRAPDVELATETESGPRRRTELADAFVDAAVAMDVERLSAVLDEMFALGTFEAVVDDVLMPALVAVGRAWAAGRLEIAAEHATTAAVQRRLAAMYEAATAGGETTAVVGLPPGSRHELGALAFAVALRRRGVGVLYVGADLPVASWRAAMADPRRRLAVIGVVTDADRPAAAAVVASLRELERAPLIAAGGRAAAGAETFGDGLAVLPERIGESAAAAARLLADTAGTTT